VEGNILKKGFIDKRFREVFYREVMHRANVISFRSS
jgi:hypothetical protein